MLLTSSMRRFCLPEANATLVAAEALGPTGLDPAFAQFLIDTGRFNTSELQQLSDGFQRYWQRCQRLYVAAPGSWFPPRLTNLLILDEPRGVLPYLEPFRNTSSSLYRCDLDTDPEYVAYLLIQLERISLLKSVRAATVFNLSYWFEVEASARAAFVSAAARARRPDAATFAAIGEALDWVDQLVHDPLRPPEAGADEPYSPIEGADLYVPQRLQARVAALADASQAGLQRAFRVTEPPAGRPTGAALDAVVEWAESTAAQVIVVAPDGTTVWRPNMESAGRLRRALQSATSEAIASIHADLQIIDQRSRQFLAAVHDVDALPRRCAVLEAGGGAYVDAARRAIVYELKQPAFDTRAAAAPPYHRLLLGARAMHEWGHIAHTAKLIRVPEERKSAYRAARQQLGEVFAEVIGKLPARVGDHISADLALLTAGGTDLPSALARKTLSRVGDYLANLLSAQFIPGEEMQAYVRTNVSHHLDENLGLISELARFSYEVHYLALANLPRDYFLATSWYGDYFLRSGLVSEQDSDALFDATGRVLACYEIDTSRISLPSASAAAA